MSFILLVPFLFWLLFSFWGRVELKTKFDNKNCPYKLLTQVYIGFVFRERKFLVKIFQLEFLSLLSKVKIRFRCLLFKIWPGKKAVIIEPKNKMNIKQIKSRLPGNEKRKLIQKNLHIKCRSLKIRLNYGLQNTAVTGFVYGLCWDIIALIVTSLQNIVIFLKKPVIEIDPVWQESDFHFVFSVIFQVKPVNIIITGLKVLFFNLKHLKLKKKNKMKS